MAISRRTNNINRHLSVPGFLNKLYNMVDESNSNDLIRWSDDGETFIVTRHEEFAKQVLPRFFKHSNFSSFVRQLNMYGFHKVPHLQQGVLQADTPDAESWEFSNPNFQRDQPDLLHYVKRKRASKNGDAPGRSPGQRGGVSDQDLDQLQGSSLQAILEEIKSIKDHQMTISSDFKRLQQDNTALWNEVTAARQQYTHQQETIDKILKFLASIFSNERRVADFLPQKRRLIADSVDANRSSDDSYGNNLGSSRLQEQHPGQRQQSPLRGNGNAFSDALENNLTQRFRELSSITEGKSMFTPFVLCATTDIPAPNFAAHSLLRLAEEQAQSLSTKESLPSQTTPAVGPKQHQSRESYSELNSPGRSSLIRSPAERPRRPRKTVEDLQRDIESLDSSIESITRYISDVIEPNIPKKRKSSQGQMSPSRLSSASPALAPGATVGPRLSSPPKLDLPLPSSSVMFGASGLASPTRGGTTSLITQPPGINTSNFTPDQLEILQQLWHAMQSFNTNEAASVTPLSAATPSAGVTTTNGTNGLYHQQQLIAPLTSGAIANNIADPANYLIDWTTSTHPQLAGSTMASEIHDFGPIAGGIDQFATTTTDIAHAAAAVVASAPQTSVAATVTPTSVTISQEELPRSNLDARSSQLVAMDLAPFVAPEIAVPVPLTVGPLLTTSGTSTDLLPTASTQDPTTTVTTVADSSMIPTAVLVSDSEVDDKNNNPR
ncbi:Heat shock transcription factor [Spiromyces aspiralis]|uniref:Heat shock transcription factor n=1 Tax=Spiromyces aspiralis TaxID=68401 RepID=A0ACC1HW35_9FUNG|nr:Heat shock transcription factor [Spiromyces aspiralis]